MKGLIVKGIGGFYYVKTDVGTIEAKGRGIFKKDGIILSVGDYVDVEIIDDVLLKGIINSIYPRKNQFIRPPIANVDMFLVVTTPAKPKPNFAVLDKFLIMAEVNNVDAVICLNKCDLASEKEINGVKDVYKNVYPVIETSAQTGYGLDELIKTISGRTVALAGPSGVGKSTLINALHPAANMETGSISEKTSRGKHTTRHAEIFSIQGGGLIFDTPGFTSFDILDADEDSLMSYYPEIEDIRGKCRYDDCKHLKEPDCAVRGAVSGGLIHPMRYNSYVANMESIKEKRRNNLKR